MTSEILRIPTVSTAPSVATKNNPAPQAIPSPAVIQMALAVVSPLTSPSTSLYVLGVSLGKRLPPLPRRLRLSRMLASLPDVVITCQWHGVMCGSWFVMMSCAGQLYCCTTECLGRAKAT